MIRIIRIPEDEKEFRKFCEGWGWDCFGNVGRRAWIPHLSTYLRGCEYVIDTGENFTIATYEELEGLKKTLDKFLREEKHK